MWPLKRKSPEIVTVSISPQKMALSWIKEENKKITIKSYKPFSFEHLEFEKSIVFNPTKIKTLAKQFLEENNIKKASFSIAVSGPSIFEKIVKLAKASPHKQDFKCEELKQLNWNYTYIGPSPDNGFDFYICGIKRELLFQYRLLMINTSVTPVVITTSKTAQIELYKYLRGKEFRQSQLVIDLHKNNYDTQSIFTLEDISKNFIFGKNSTDELKSEYQSLATNIGLFLLGNKS